MAYDDYEKVAAAIRFIRQESINQPELGEVASHLGLSPFHLQRLFLRWAGVSPKRFLQYLTSQKAKRLLRQSASLLETSDDVGLSSGSRLHDLFVVTDAVTPGEFKSGGKDLEIWWGIHPSPFGECLIAITTRGICALTFIDEYPAVALERLQKDWPSARFIHEENKTATKMQEVFAPLNADTRKPVAVLLKGTNFQLQVWQALLTIPSGQITSYGQLAKQLGTPSASRAVGTAIGANPIAWLIPCHRVLRGDGMIGGYRWGEERKLAILSQEFSSAESC